MRRATFLGLWALAGVATLGGCSSKPELSTEEGWVRLAAVPGPSRRLFHHPWRPQAAEPDWGQQRRRDHQRDA